MKLLKAIAPAVLIVGLMGCSTNYASEYEAIKACESKAQDNNAFATSGLTCRRERATNQVLLVEFTRKDSDTWSSRKYGKVLKNYRY